MKKIPSIIKVSVVLASAFLMAGVSMANAADKPEGVGQYRPEGVSGTRPEGVGQYRPEGVTGRPAGIARPAEWEGNTRPEGVGGTRPEGATRPAGAGGRPAGK